MTQMQSPIGKAQRLGKVINSRDIPSAVMPANTVFVDRGSPFANPFKEDPTVSTDKACNSYDLMLANSPKTLAKLDVLRGMDLICFDAPNRSHADTLVVLAAMIYDDRLKWADMINARMSDYEIPRLAA
jgi:hypothetical protein